MQLTIIGSGTAIPVRARGYAGLYARVGQEQVLLDSGPGTLQRLAAIGVTFRDLDRVCYTHCHPDHCLDLVSLLFAMRISPAEGQRQLAPRTKPLTIYGPPGLRALHAQLNAAYRGVLTPRSYALRIEEIDETVLELPGYRLRTHRMRHSIEAVGYRLEAQGRVIAYSGDTEECDGVVALGRSADLLALECSTTDEHQVDGHLTPSACGRVAAQSGCRRLVLTHFYPVFDDYDVLGRVRRHFQGPVTLAEDGVTFEV